MAHQFTFESIPPGHLPDYTAETLHPGTVDVFYNDILSRNNGRWNSMASGWKLTEASIAMRAAGSRIEFPVQRIYQNFQFAAQREHPPEPGDDTFRLARLGAAELPRFQARAEQRTATATEQRIAFVSYCAYMNEVLSAPREEINYGALSTALPHGVFNRPDASKESRLELAIGSPREALGRDTIRNHSSYVLLDSETKFPVTTYFRGDNSSGQMGSTLRVGYKIQEALTGHEKLTNVEDIVEVQSSTRLIAYTLIRQARGETLLSEEKDVLEQVALTFKDKITRDMDAV